MAGNYRNSGDKKPFSVPKTLESEGIVKPILPTVNYIAEKARKEQLWIFDPHEKLWYNPDEFQDLFGRVGRGIDDLIKRIVLKDPVEAVEQGYNKLQDFNGRVLAYFKNKIELKVNPEYLATFLDCFFEIILVSISAMGERSNKHGLKFRL